MFIFSMEDLIRSFSFNFSLFFFLFCGLQTNVVWIGGSWSASQFWESKPLRWIVNGGSREKEGWGTKLKRGKSFWYLVGAIMEIRKHLFRHSYHIILVWLQGFSIPRPARSNTILTCHFILFYWKLGMVRFGLFTPRHTSN